MRIIKAILSAMFLSVSGMVLGSQTVINIPAEAQGDATDVVRTALALAPKSNVKIIFEKGTYRFSKKNAYGKYHSITNHENGYKYIALNLDGFDNVEVDGGGSEFLFSGTILPVLVQNSQNVTLRNFTIDWDVPFFIQSEVVGVDRGGDYYDVKMCRDGYSWSVDNDRVLFPQGVDFVYSGVGESLVFDKERRAPIYGSANLDIHRREDVKVRQLCDSVLRITEPQRLRTMPPVGSIMTFKGPMGENRYAPAIHCITSENINVENVTVYHALGMGFLGERAENITLSEFNVMLREGSDRMISATADATHFCNCKGDILVEKCLFENMLDDGTNVHGTYLKVADIVDNHTLQADLHHFQQRGFVFGERGDEVWFLIAPSVVRVEVNTIESFTQINEHMCEIKFTKPLPKSLHVGDLVENKTWNSSTFTLRDCTIRNHRARNIVIKAPNKVVVENNYLQSMMASILLRGESSHWYESGATTDVTIRGNHFDNCVFGGGEQAVLFVSPRMASQFSKRQIFDNNLLFEDNLITTFDNMIVDATNVCGLTIRNNRVIQKSDNKPFNPQKHLYNITNCKNVEIEGNEYDGNHKLILKMDAATCKVEAQKK